MSLATPQLIERMEQALSWDGSRVKPGQKYEPVAMAGEGYPIETGNTATIRTTAIDFDGTIERYTLTQIEGPLVTLAQPEGGVVTIKPTDATIAAERIMAFSEAKAADYTFTMPRLDKGQVLVFELAVTDNDGLTASDSVTFSRVDEVSITTNVEGGTPPLRVDYLINRNLPNPVKSYSMDYDGDGVIDVTTTNTDDFMHIFEQPGSYTSRIVMTDDQGNQFEDTINIEVLAPDKARVLAKGPTPDKTLAAIKKQWDATLAALASGDIEKAMSYFSLYSQKYQYHARFSQMNNEQLKMFLATLSELNLTATQGPVAICELNIIRGEHRYTVPVSFADNGSGWKIVEFEEALYPTQIF